jgi:arylsulfatase A-like enzyme/Flp pilus assembly protein TadD
LATRALKLGTALGLPLAVLLASCRPGPATLDRSRPDILLITVDTLRPDALGWISGRNTTPVLDRLAGEGFRFPAAIAPAPLTAPAHISMMSGLVPRRHGVRDNGQVLGSAPTLIAEVLREHGYTTAAFVSGYPLKNSFGLDRGFSHYDDTLTAGEGAWLERRADETTAAALKWARTASSPLFLWVHYYDPHFPYEQPNVAECAGWRGSYDCEVAAVDRSVGDLLRGLGDGERLSIVVGDHGESLGEHGEGTHGFFIYESTVRVPMMIHFPGRLAPGESPASARLVDIAPTVLDLLDLPAFEGVDGVSLVPTIEGRGQELPPAYVESRQPWRSYGWAPLRSVRHGDFKLIAAPRPELYDLATDPGESENLVGRDRDKVRELRVLLAAAEALPAVAASATADDPETLDALRALGYLGGGSPAGEPGADAPDPKDRLALRELLTEADELARRGDIRGALERFDRTLAEEPGNLFALSRSGAALLQSGDLRGAVTRLEEALRLGPDQAETRELLAEALTRSGQLERAAREWMELVRLHPRRARPWSNLGATLGQLGRFTEAVEAYGRAAELEPRNPDRWVRLAFAEHAADDITGAITHLDEAAGLAGEEFAHAGALGILLASRGRVEEALRYLPRSRPEEKEFAEARYQLAILWAEAQQMEAARTALTEALRAEPELRPRAAADSRLAPLLP